MSRTAGEQPLFITICEHSGGNKLDPPDLKPLDEDEYG